MCKTSVKKHQSNSTWRKWWRMCYTKNLGIVSTMEESYALSNFLRSLTVSVTLDGAPKPWTPCWLCYDFQCTENLFCILQNKYLWMGDTDFVLLKCGADVWTQVFSSIEMAKICLGQMHTTTGRFCLTNLPFFKLDETWQLFRKVQTLPTGRFWISKFAIFHPKLGSCCHGNGLKSVAMATKSYVSKLKM